MPIVHWQDNIGLRMEGRGSDNDQMKTEKAEISDTPNKTGDEAQNGELKKAVDEKNGVDGKGKKKGGGEESFLRRIIKRLSLKKKKTKKSAVEKDIGDDETDSTAQLDAEPKIVEEVNIEVHYPHIHKPIHVILIVKYNKVAAERPATPPTAPLGRPPLPRGISSPVSATTYHSRWATVKSFTLSNIYPLHLLQ